MAIKRGKARKSLRDVLLENRKALEMYAAMSDKPMPPQSVEIPPEPKKRVKSNLPRKHPLEKEVQKSILQLLRKHPRVHWIARFNSGKFVEGNRYISANSQDGMSDLMGMLKGGRLLAIEVKTQTGKIQPKQQLFLDLINQGGGLAFVARSVEDVLKHI